MLEHTSAFETHESRDTRKLFDAELGTAVYVCTDSYICNITGEEFYLQASGTTKEDAIENCTPLTAAESLNHILCREHEYVIDFDKLRAAMEEESFTMPTGLTREQKRAYIKACARGEITPD